MTIGDVTLYYQTAGQGDPLVLVHGLSGSGRWWRRNVPALARHHRVYTLDLIGFGRSRSGRWRARQRFVLGAAADLLADFLDRLAISSATVIGHSMGGYVAAEMTARHSNRVNRLVLVDAAALPFERGYAGHILGLLTGIQRCRPDFYPILLTDAAQAGALTIARAARDLLHVDTPPLAAIDIPTLVVWGERDTIVPLALGRRLVASLPNAELVVLPRAGHTPMWDQPDAFNAAVLEFLAGDRAASA
ncbi:MAG: alpha/beta fold hydrolase [Chloroflexi bacterium]|nr:alpha/beta fold hydrolase [Chloroflexota bacterium]